MEKLLNLVKRLRGPGGCPWDAEQTDQTLKIYLLEETYEVLEAIEKESPEAVCGELGDLLFQIVFLAELAEERGEFAFTDVVLRITQKMIHRHPHVFGNVSVENAEEVAANWAKIKREENGGLEPVSKAFKSVPDKLPALLRSHRISERAAKTGFDWTDRQDIHEKVVEELEELNQAIAEGHGERVKEEMGDLLFSIVNLARHWGLNAEDVLRSANQKFIERFEKMEQILSESGAALEDASLEQMNRAWEAVKRQKA